MKNKKAITGVIISKIIAKAICSTPFNRKVTRNSEIKGKAI